MALDPRQRRVQAKRGMDLQHHVAPKVVQCVKAPNYTSTPATPIVGKWASGATFAEYGDPKHSARAVSRRFKGLSLRPVLPDHDRPAPVRPPGTYPAVAGTGCGLAAGGVAPKMDLTIGTGGTLVNAYPSTANQSLGLAVGTACLFTVPGSAGGTPGTVQTVVAPLDGWGGIATYNTDSNMFGDLLYGNEGLPGNPLSSFFTNGFGGYFEPGPAGRTVRAIHGRAGERVSCSGSGSNPPPISGQARATVRSGLFSGAPGSFFVVTAASS